MASRTCLRFSGVVSRHHGMEPPPGGGRLRRSDDCPLDRNQAKPVFKSIASASAAVKRGSLGMNFDRGGKNFSAQRRGALFVGQGLQVEFDCLTDIGQSLLDRVSLRLAPV